MNDREFREEFAAATRKAEEKHGSGPAVQWTPALLERFRRASDAARAAGRDQFTFEPTPGRPVVYLCVYADLLIRDLSAAFDDVERN